MEYLFILRDIGVFSIAMWFIQNLISKSSDKKFETYKVELDHKTKEFQSSLDSKMELYKAELNLQNYKSTKIYEQQLNAIIELHKKLVKLNNDMQIMTAVVKQVYKDAEREEDDRIKNAGISYNEFISFYHDNLIFIPKNTTRKLNYIRDEYWNSYNDYTFGRNFGLNNKFSFEQMKQSSENVKKNIQPAIEQLLFDFRALIGVELN